MISLWAWSLQWNTVHSPTCLPTHCTIIINSSFEEACLYCFANYPIRFCQAAIYWQQWWASSGIRFKLVSNINWGSTQGASFSSGLIWYIRLASILYFLCSDSLWQYQSAQGGSGQIESGLLKNYRTKRTFLKNLSKCANRKTHVPCWLQQSRRARMAAKSQTIQVREEIEHRHRMSGTGGWWPPQYVRSVYPQWRWVWVRVSDGATHVRD